MAVSPGHFREHRASLRTLVDLLTGSRKNKSTFAQASLTFSPAGDDRTTEMQQPSYMTWQLNSWISIISCGGVVKEPLETVVFLCNMKHGVLFLLCVALNHWHHVVASEQPSSALLAPICQIWLFQCFSVHLPAGPRPATSHCANGRVWTSQQLLLPSCSSKNSVALIIFLNPSQRRGATSNQIKLFHCTHCI